MSVFLAKILRYSLGSLLIILALNAFAGGYYAMSGAKDVPLEWLDGTIFNTYFIPGLILFVVIGGSALLAGIAVFKRHALAKLASLLAVVLVFLWLIIQISLIGYVSWVQPVTALLVLLILILTFMLPKK